MKCRVPAGTVTTVSFHNIAVRLFVAAAIILFSGKAANFAFAAPPDHDAEIFFYSGGKKHVLKPEPGWVAAAVTDNAAFDEVERGLKKDSVADPGEKSVRHDKLGIIAVKLSDPAHKPKAKDALGKIKGARYAARVFKNGQRDPIIETEEFVIRFEDDVKRAEVDKLLKAHGAEVVRPLGDFAPNGFVARIKNPNETSATDVANELHGQPGVLYSHPDLIWPKQHRFAPNDPIYPQQWHLNNDGSNGGTVAADIRAQRAWDITRGDPNIIIAIVDDGVDMDHEDFATSGKFINGWDFVGNDSNPRPGTGQNHGTSCAGLAAANGNNSIGVSGVAPNCRIMPIRLLGPNETFSSEAAAISHAKNNGADVISNSWGPTDGTGQSQPCPDVVYNAITDAADNGRGGKGCVITWAAGNGNESVDLDGYASHPKVICVAASMRNDTRSPYSDFGNAIDVAAPGGSQAGDMVTVDRTGSAGYSSTNYTVGFNGTSAATPVVSGVAALLLSSEPNLTRAQVRQRLIDSADFIDTANAAYDSNGHSSLYGYGRVNAWMALAWNDNTQPTVTIRTPTNNLITENLAAADGSYSDQGTGVLRVQVKIRNRTNGEWWNWRWGFFGPSGDLEENFKEATLASGSWSVLLPDLTQGSFELQVRAEDKAGLFSGWVINNFSLDNQGPTVAISSPTSGSSYTSLSQASGTASDTGVGVGFVRVAIFNQNTGVWWNWNGNTWGTATFDWNTNVRNATGTTSWTIALPSFAEGNYQIHAQAVDNANKGSAWVASSFVLDSGDPTITFSPLTNQATVFDFSRLGGTVSEPGTVTFRITEFNVGGTDRYWNGSGWITDGNSSSVWLAAANNGSIWWPGATLPRRGQTRAGHYLIDAKIVDRAGKIGTLNLVVIRSAQDTTPPDLSITAPVANQVFTNNFLPTFYGNVFDGESGIADVTTYLMRSTGSGFEYWNGRNWSMTPTALPAQFNFDTWQSPVTSGTTAYNLPSGSNLRNGTYQLQISANNKEEPAGTRGTSVTFVVDYHPVYTWTLGSFRDSDSNNDNYYWDNPENWSPYGVPPTDAIAVISSDTCDARPMGSLQVYGINLSGGTFYTSGALIRKLNVSGGTLNGGAVNITTNGTFNWTAGVLGGTYTFLPGSTVNLSGNGTKQLASFAVVNNSGTVNWNGGGAIYTYAYSSGDFSTFNNLSNGVFNVLADGRVFDYTYNPSYFNNQPGALFAKTSGTGTSSINSFYFFNRGETRCDSGTLLFDDRLYLEDGGVFSGTEKFRFQAGRAEARGATVLRSATFYIDSGTFHGEPGSLLVTTNSGAFEWTGGNFDGQIELAPNSTLRLSGGSAKTLNSYCHLNNRGNIVWNGTGDIYTYAYSSPDYSVIENFSGSTFLVTSNANFTYTYNPSSFIVRSGATFRKTAGGGATRCDWYFNNDGDVESQSGSVNLNGGGTSGGRFIAGSGALVKFTGGTQTWNGGTRLKGAGKIQIDGGTVTRNGTVSSDDSNLATLEIVTGTFNGVGTLSGNVQANWFAGTIGGTLNVAPTVTFNASGSGTKTLNNFAVFNNNGTFNWSGAGKLYTYAYSSPDFSTFNNLSNAVFNLQTDGDLFDVTYNRSFFTNHPGALFVKSGGSGTNTIDEFGFDNFGEIRIETGTIRFNDIAKLGAGSQLTGAGTLQIAGNVQLDTSLPSSATIVLLAGTLTGTTNAAYTGSADFNWTGGAMAGRFQLQSGSRMNITGSENKSLNNFAVFENYGTVNWTGPGKIYTYAYSSPDYATFNNRDNAVFNIGTDGPVFEITYNPSFFTNFPGGLIAKTGGAGTNQINSYYVRNFGEVRVNTGTVLFNDVLSVYDGSRLTGAGTVRFAGNVSLQGTVNGSCNVALNAGTLTGAVVSNVVPAYTGSGLFSWEAGTIAGQLSLLNGSTMNLSGGSAKTLNNFAMLNNYGTMNWSGPGRIYTYAYSAGDFSTLNNYGVFNALTDGQLFEITYNRSFFTNHANARFVKTAGTGSTLINAFVFANRGETRANTGTIEFNDLCELEHNSMLAGPGTFLVSGGQTTLRGTLDLNGSLLRINNGTFYNPPTASASVNTRNGGVLEWSGGTISGIFSLAAGSMMNLTGGTKTFGDATAFNNYGNITWSAGDLYRYAYSSGDGCTVNNRPGGVFDVTGNAAFTYTYNPSTFNNELGATFRRLNSTGTTRCDWYFNNLGTLDIRSGIARFENAFTAGPLSSFQFTLGGYSAGTNYGRIVHGSSISLGGQLSVILTNDFMPTNESVFTFVDYGSRSGQFSGVNLPEISDGLEWRSEYSATSFKARIRLTPVCSPVRDGLLAWWPGDGGTNIIGGENLSAANGATNSTGLVGSAFSLNGSSQYWSVEDSATLRPTNLTVEGWVNFADASGLRVLFGKAYGNSYFDSYQIWLQDGVLHAAITADSGFQSYLSYNWTPPLGTWHHVAFTYDQTEKTGVLYLDGSAVATDTNAPGPIVYDSRPFLVGADIENQSYAFFFSGQIDEVALYNRALTSSEVASIFAAEALGRCPAPAIPNYLLTTEINGNGAIIISPESTNGYYLSNTVVTLTAVPAENEAFAGWSGAVTSTNTSIEITMTQDTMVTALFTNVPPPNYLLTTGVSPLGNGIVTVSPPSTNGYYESNTVVTLTAVPATGKIFVRWSGAATNSQNPLNIAINADTAITAIFANAPKQFLLTTNISPAGSGRIVMDPVSTNRLYYSNTVVTLTAIPAAGKGFAGWSGASGAKTNIIRITMNTNKTITAMFTNLPPSYHLTTTVSPLNGGTVTVTPLSTNGNYFSNTLVTLKAVPATGFKFSRWSGGVVSTNAQISLRMTSAKTLSAIFTNLPVYTLSASLNPPSAGYVYANPYSPSNAYYAGTVVSLTASSNDTNVFSVWTGGVSSLSNSVNITMNANKSVTALFNNPGKFIFQNTNGLMSLWFMQSTQRVATATLNNAVAVPPNWKLVSAIDFDYNNAKDLLFAGTNGQAAVWLMNGNFIGSKVLLRGGFAMASSWRLCGAADVNYDLSPDLIWQNTNGVINVWLMYGTTYFTNVSLPTKVSTGWRAAAVADLDLNGSPDLLFQNASGQVALWLMSGYVRTTSFLLNSGTSPGTGVILRGVTDVDGDGQTDIVFQRPDGTLIVWLMNGTTFSRSIVLSPGIAPSWALKGLK